MFRVLLCVALLATAVLGAPASEEPPIPGVVDAMDQLNIALLTGDVSKRDEGIEELEERDEGIDDSGIRYPDEPPEEGNNDDSLFEGDMVLTAEQQKAMDDLTGDEGELQKRKFWKFAKLWPDKTVYFHPLSGSSSWINSIEAAMRHIEANTCIKFKQRTTGNRLNFFVGAGCYSSIGMVNSNNGQKISIGRGCTSLGVVVHEIIHAMGMFHEQSRPDRDNYVTINWGNIQQGKESNFKKYDWNQVITKNIPYDFGSVMHYGSKLFAKDRTRNTITVKDASKAHLLGQRSGLSRSDIKLISAVYGCSDTGGGGGGTVVTRPTQAPANCKDTTTRCPTYEKYGYCKKTHRYYKSMLSMCKKTCGFCNGGGSVVTRKPTQAPTTKTPSTGANCKDTTTRCPTYEKNGYCKKTHRYYKSMLSMCKKTCGFCNGGGSVVTRKPTQTPTTKTPSTGGSQNCADTSEHCARYVQSGYCKNTHKYYRSMERMCRKSCGICKPSSGTGGTGASTCQDQSSKCAGYRAKRYCMRTCKNTNLAFMQSKCQKTCGFCPGVCEDLDIYCASFKKQGYCNSSSNWYRYTRINCEKTCGVC